MVLDTSVLQISDAVFRYVGPYQGSEMGKAISMEFALYTTALVLLLGGVACLVATMTVEKDRKVSAEVLGGVPL